MKRQPAILVVDDCPLARKTAELVLNALGYRDLGQAADGAAALEAMRSKAFDLVITDWQMPGMDGLALVEAMRGDERLRGIPVVLLTAESRRADVRKAMKTGVDSYMLKPYTYETMERTMREFFP